MFCGVQVCVVISICTHNAACFVLKSGERNILQVSYHSQLFYVSATDDYVNCNGTNMSVQNFCMLK